MLLKELTSVCVQAFGGPGRPMMSISANKPLNSENTAQMGFSFIFEARYAEELILALMKAKMEAAKIAAGEAKG